MATQKRTQTKPSPAWTSAVRTVATLAYGMCAVGAVAPAAAQDASAPLPEYLWAIDESLWSGPAVGEDYTIELAVGLWEPSPTVVASSEQFGITGTRIDFGADLGLGRMRHPDARLTLKRGRQKLRVSVVPMRYRQTRTLARELVFSGIRFDAALPVESTLDWNAWRFGYEIDVISLPRAYIGLIAEAKYTQIDTTLTTPTLDPEWVKVRVPIPAIGLVVRAYPTRFTAITAEMTGIRIPAETLDEGNGEYIDLDIYATLNLSRMIGISVGYRSIDFNYRYERDAGDLKLEGLYLQGVIRY